MRCILLGRFKLQKEESPVESYWNLVLILWQYNSLFSQQYSTSSNLGTGDKQKTRRMVLAVQISPRSDFSKSEPPIKAERFLDCENEYPIGGTFRVQQCQPS